jgi:hypothetical protein
MTTLVEFIEGEAMTRGTVTTARKPANLKLQVSVTL